MKNMKKLLISILAAFCMCASFTAVYAVEGNKKESTRVTFTNKKDNRPDLYVHKRVISEEGYSAPSDVVFTFYLKLDGEVARNQPYILLDKNGNDIKKDVTDVNGRFQLKADQTAKFEYLGNGVSYEVKEMEMENFIQVSPAQGTSATGIIPSEGVRVEFVNQYMPKTEGEKANLTITKHVTYPENYELPDSNTEFTFVLTLNRKAYAKETYTVKNSQTNEVITTRVTNENGELTLKANETAVFMNVEANVDYRVEERSKEGWSVVGQTIQEGAVQAPSTNIHYTNKINAFGVKKTVLNGDSGDTDFTFLLLKDDKKAWSGVKYYLYNNDGTLVKPDREHYTNDKGYFTLKHGQTAIFTGIPEDTVYHVSEVAQLGFTQITPVDSEGYQNMIVKDNVEILPFENQIVEEKGSLVVTKIIENMTNDAAHAEAEFTFVLRSKPTGGHEYEPLADKVYTTLEGSFKTDEKGYFKLKANQIARFESLTKGIEYQVEEIQTNPEYHIDDEENLIQSAFLTNDSILEFKFVNQYTNTLLDVKIHKKNHDNELLAGAEFDLYMGEGLVNKVGNGITDDNGEIHIDNLKPGVYYLKEEKAPNGYELLVKPIKIEIVRDEMGKLVVSIDSETVNDTNQQNQIYIEKNPSGDDIVHVTVYNNKPFHLPLVGGIGIVGFIVVALSGIGTIIYRLRKMNKK